MEKPLTPKEFILDAITTLRSVGSNHRGIHLRELEALFRNQFGDTLAATLTEMIQAAEVVAITWVHKRDRYSSRSKPDDAHVHGSFPDKDYPDDTDPVLYVPGQMSRWCMSFVHRAPTMAIRKVMAERRTQMLESQKRRQEERWGLRSA